MVELLSTVSRSPACARGGPGRLWLVFGDETNGGETYGGGRFLVTGPVQPDGRVEVDFNLAYNPPCVFSPYATCPLPPDGNRLPLRIEAGERVFAGSGSPSRRGSVAILIDVAIEQLGELPRAAERRAVAAVDLVGLDAEPRPDERPEPSRREERSFRHRTNRVGMSGHPASGHDSRPGVSDCRRPRLQGLVGKRRRDVLVEDRRGRLSPRGARAPSPCSRTSPRPFRRATGSSPRRGR